MPGQWAGSSRGASLPPDWAARRRRILERDGYRCTWLEDHPDGNGGLRDYLAGNYHDSQRCTERARDVDHCGDRHDHRDEVLRSLGSYHHGQRSSAQGNAARVRLSNKRKPEVHPGLR